MPTATHTSTPHSPGHTNNPSTTEPVDHGKKKKGSGRKTKKIKTKRKAGKRKREKNREGGGRREKKERRGAGDHRTPRPKAQGAGKTARKTQRGPKTGKEKRSDNHKQGKHRARRDRPWTMLRRSITRPGGRPARRGQEELAHAYTQRNRKERCWRPHETAWVHWPSPLLRDGSYGKPDASVIGFRHGNHRSARGAT